MRRANLKKIKSAPKLLFGLGIVGAVFCIALALSYSRTTTPQIVLKLGAQQIEYQLEPVETFEDQQKGLSGRTGLGDKSGMIFVYSNDSERCFWMKDMKFAIDIIWLDSDQRITRIEREVSPVTYPATYCASAQNVVELPAGTSRFFDLAVSDRLQL